MDSKLAMAVVTAGTITFGAATVCMAQVGVADPLGIGPAAQVVAAAPDGSGPQTSLSGDPATSVVVVSTPSTGASSDQLTAGGAYDPGTTMAAVATEGSTTNSTSGSGQSVANGTSGTRSTTTTVRPTTTTVRATTTTTTTVRSTTTTTTTTVRPTTTTTYVAPTTQTPTTTVRATTTTVATATRYSVTGVPVPSDFYIPRSWTRPIPDWPSGCRRGQLEDNGVWNCQ